MELNYFKDIFFDLINDWDQDVQDIYTDDKENLFWVVMGDGSVFRIHCEKKPQTPPIAKGDPSAR